MEILALHVTENYYTDDIISQM